ncbi:MAG TPA: hypothetical protein PKK10_05180 [Woeseiaceae bacterium]|nr:hypothetical protein [Woeseiaceae bacterium]
MTAQRFAVRLAGVLLLGLYSTGSVADLASAIAKCNATVVSGDDPGEILIRDSCPDLIEDIESSQWRETLPLGWQEVLSIAQLSQLGYFESYYGQRPSAEALSLLALDEIVLGLGDATEVIDNKLFWEMFVDWFNDLLSGKPGQTAGRFSEWLSNIEISSLAVEIAFWSLSALVVAAAVVVVVMEIRAARGSLPARVLKIGRSAGRAGPGVDDQALTVADIGNAALDDRPSLLLRLILQRLESLGKIPYEPARTHREASCAASVLGSDSLHVVSRVSEFAERSRFSRGKNQPHEIEALVSAGIILVGNLTSGQA